MRSSANNPTIIPLAARNGTPQAAQPCPGGHHPHAIATPAPTGGAAPPQESMTSDHQAGRWGLARRILCCFAFVYLVLYIMLLPLRYARLVGEQLHVGVGFVEILYQVYHDCWDGLVLWVGKQVFQVDIVIRATGSGDTTFDYVQHFCYVVLAAATAALWSLLDRKRLNYARLHDWLLVGVRFYLAAILILYGSVKVIQAQMPFPPLRVLSQTFGDSSPMRLLWTFMGYSEGYNLFAGGGEMLAGLLLFCRRTRALGALVGIGVLSHVVVLNFCYDVPVKLYSSHLLAMAFYLAAPDLRRLVHFFVLNRPTAPAPERRLFQRPWLHRAALAFGMVFAFTIVASELKNAYDANRMMVAARDSAPLHGLWTVEEFAVDGKVQPRLITDRTQWRQLICDGALWGTTIQFMNDAREYYDMEVDEVRHTLVLTNRHDPARTWTLKYSQPASGRLVLEGTVTGRQVRITLWRSDESQFLLVNRGFHWINEYPFNY
jgi:hypothetical protein